MIVVPPQIGHRGAAGLAPENTLAALRAAARAGAAMVEIDVRLSADGRPVLFHDDDLDRTTNGTGPVAALTRAALAMLDAGSWFGPAFAGEPIPTLEQALTLCLELGLAVNIEIKPAAGYEVETARVALSVAASLWPDDRPPPLVTSFSSEALKTAREIVPDWSRGLLVGAVPSDWHAQTQELGCAVLVADQAELDRSIIGAIGAAGMTLLVYTLNDRERMRMLWRDGIAAICTDYPSSS
ncbi:glycerophosphodiester phosphodiesterase [Magnetospirillum molischianum]|uniref:Glycerophosphoryl diester phosphodiesterase n=1 Tax=Magnetospirillum molischianum DSM 120 TaxID=1150626 RepID=H8FTD2_MAGML|nr:glycerophosphodiester phosphodiesterase [Magnetospirillum molischianum]CCG41620.1 Glycerophosphoryl diester phosphodiesterase [Magnetospirillum molischianum DSM 120]